MKLNHNSFQEALIQCQQRIISQLEVQFNDYDCNRSDHKIDSNLSVFGVDSEIKSLQLLDAMRYATLLGGKRLRPFLVYAVGELFQVDVKILDTLAMAIECVHCYSLIHDDLPAMDNDMLRRGKPTCHIQFDEATAILAGDALQTMAFDILATGFLGDCDEHIRVKLISKLAKAIGANGLCLGQNIDLQSENRAINLEQLAFIHHHKTGVLIVTAIEFAILCATNCSNLEKQSLLDFGYAVGLAFQVQDDILDITSDSKTLGKSQGSDIKLKKSTYPLLLGLDGAQKKALQLQEDALQALSFISGDTSLLKQIAYYVTERTY